MNRFIRNPIITTNKHLARALKAEADESGYDVDIVVDNCGYEEGDNLTLRQQEVERTFYKKEVENGKASTSLDV